MASSKLAIRLYLFVSISVLATAFQGVPVPCSEQSRLTIPARTKLNAVSSRLSRATTSLHDWTTGVGAAAGIKVGGVSIQESKYGGLGLVATQTSVPPNTVLISIPSTVALTVDSSSGPNDAALVDLAVRDRKALREAPWFVQFSIYLQALDKISSTRGLAGNVLPMRPWLDSLPRSFDTPIHWSSSSLSDLQYNHLLDSVARQEMEWKALYANMERIANIPLKLNYDDFVWGCECARSRAFSGAYTGSAFNPGIYAFTLLLVTAYVGLGLGTLEQAANGAGLVFCASIFKDFILPKFFKTKKYIICPLIDMANHNSLEPTADVSFEFFTDAFSLASFSTAAPIDRGSEVLISYGARSNDQLLQYYGFVERNNPHDVYVMPPLRNWNIAALEQACGVESFAPGRLEKLNRAGLLGSSGGSMSSKDAVATTSAAVDDSYNLANPKGGVVVSRAAGIDPAVMQALRALVSTQEEWMAAGEAIGNFSEEMSPANERRATMAARKAMELELASKPTTLEQDMELWKRRTSTKSNLDREEELALSFRIEKKKLLQEVIDKM